MIGKILTHLLGNTDEDADAAHSKDVDDTCEDLVEFEQGGWILVSMQENLPVERPEDSALETLLIEHPSMSIYQMRPVNQEEDQESEGEDSVRLVPVRQGVSWKRGLWEAPLACRLRLLPLPDRRRLTRSALHRQNLVNTRFCPAKRRYGHFKQPCQRLYSY